MAWPIVINGHTYNESDFTGYGYKTAMPSAFNDVEERATDTETAATAAAASAVTALNAPGTSATSTTSLAIGTGSQTLTIQTGKAVVPGMEVVIAYTTTPTIRMAGTVTAYDSGTGALAVQASLASGAGTYAAWTVSLTAPVSGVGRHARWIGAGEMTPRVTNGASAGTVQTASGLVVRTLDFDAAVAEHAQIAVQMPKRWDAGTVSARHVWSTVCQTPNLPASYDYAHAYGSGNRSATVTVSTSFTLGGGAVADWVNGNTADAAAYISSGQAATGKEIKFVFAAAVSINQVRWYCEASIPVLGTFSWQGSNDGVNWTTLDSGISLMSAGGITTYNVTPGMYTQYRFYGTSGTTGTGYWIRETEFQAGTPVSVAPEAGVAWCTRAVALSDAGALTTAFGSAVTIIDAWQAAASAALITDESAAMTIGNTPAETDLVVLEVYRDVTHTDDTLPADARLHGVTLFYTSDAVTDD